MELKNIIYFILFSLFLLGCSSKEITLTVQKPASINVSSNIKKVFVDPKLFNAQKDYLNLKEKVLKKLVSSLNQSGRFIVTYGPLSNYDPNVETVGLIQGEIISNYELDIGQATKKVRCTLLTPSSTTRSHRGFPCRITTLTSSLVESGFDIVTDQLIGPNKVQPSIDEAIRSNQYKNIILNAQLNFSFNSIGDQTTTLTVRSDIASYGKQIPISSSYKNVNESSSAMSGLAPKLTKKRAVVYKTKPSNKVRWISKKQFNLRELSKKEQNKITDDLISKAITPFLRTISPYKVNIQTNIATRGNANVTEWIQKGEFIRAREKLESLQEKKSADLYNLGLAYEGTAISIQDYETAYEFYRRAFEESPKNQMFAKAVGRMSLRLIEMNALTLQTKSITEEK